MRTLRAEDCLLITPNWSYQSSTLTRVGPVRLICNQLFFSSSVSFYTGEDLRFTKNLTRSLCDQICTQPVNWEKATLLENVTHLIDFGPGGSSGIGGLTHKNKEGTGLQVIVAGCNTSQALRVVSVALPLSCFFGGGFTWRTTRSKPY
jgi:hypothetical protein